MRYLASKNGKWLVAFEDDMQSGFVEKQDTKKTKFKWFFGDGTVFIEGNDVPKYIIELIKNNAE